MRYAPIAISDRLMPPEGSRMVPSWIKMRVDLDRHPKVKRMSRVLKADRLRVIGGLWAVWALFDTYDTAPAEDSGDGPDQPRNGLLEFYTLDDIDDEIRWRGFAAAMSDIGWLAETEQGLVAPDYTEHNGPTAKRRALDTKRKSNGSKAEKNPRRRGDSSGNDAGQISASDAEKDDDDARTRGRGRGREEKYTSHSSAEDLPPVRAPAAVCRALKAAGIPGVSPSHPRLLALLEAGATPEEFVDAAPKGVGKADGFAYVLGVVEGRRRDAAITRNGVHHGPMPRAESAMQREARERVEAAVPGLAPSRQAAPTTEPMEVVDVAARRVG
jgi:hypothetical protein